MVKEFLSVLHRHLQRLRVPQRCHYQLVKLPQLQYNLGPKLALHLLKKQLQRDLYPQERPQSPGQILSEQSQLFLYHRRRQESLAAQFKQMASPP